MKEKTCCITCHQPPPLRATSHRRLSYFNKLLGGSETADAQRQQDPAAGVAALGRVLGELLADLTVDLVPGMEKRCLEPDKSSQLCCWGVGGGGWCSYLKT